MCRLLPTRVCPALLKQNTNHTATNFASFKQRSKHYADDWGISFFTVVAQRAVTALATE